MATEVFTKEQFEEALPTEPMWVYIGLLQGEHSYAIYIPGTNKRVVIRSSVKASGFAAETGKDSIRLWVEYQYKDKWHPLRKLGRWITRVPRWGKRMRSKIGELLNLAIRDSNNQTQKPEELVAEKALSSDKSKPACPKCGKTMTRRERRSDGNPFWGCPSFPKCRGTRPFNQKLKKEMAKKFTPNKYQVAIFDWVRNGESHAVCEAVAGSGKTTTGLEALKYMEGNVLFCAFNRHIADEMAQRAPQNVEVSTIHSLGLRNLTNYLGVRPKIDAKKVRNVVEGLVEEWEKALIPPILQLISLVKATLTDPEDVVALEALSNYYGVELNGDEEKIFRLVPKAIVISNRQTGVVDFDDMIFLPNALRIACQKFDWVFVDEVQDLNKAQIELVLKSVKEGGRVLAVGDRSQSMYGFRGADTEAMQNIIERLGATLLPLSITYRCPISHVEVAQYLVPQIEAAPNARKGILDFIDPFYMHSRAGDGDMILSRVNAPLVKIAFTLIRAGKKATIRGRDIGQGLITFIDKMKAADIDTLIDKMNIYEAKETRKLVKAEKLGQLQMLQDKIETIHALMDGAYSISQLKGKIEQIFSDKVEGIVCSSIHRAKGLEAERVFIVEPHLLPHPLAKQPWELIQEQNIAYVALTRSKSELYIVGNTLPAAGL